MKNPKLFSLLLACLLATALFCGCQEEPVVTEAPSTESTVPTEPQWVGYSGPGAEYVPFYTDGRDAEWEEDLLYFADSCLSDHQMLRNRKFIVNLPGIRTDSANFYDAELQEAFLEEVNALIPEISGLADEAILSRIQKILALFHDEHTRLEYYPETIYPIYFMPIYEDGEPVFYAVVLPQKNEALLYTQLYAINGYTVDQIIEKMRPFICYENEYGLVYALAWGGCGSQYLSLPYLLEASGISEPGDQWAVYTLMDSEGNTYNLNMRVWDSRTNLCGTSIVMALPIPFLDCDTDDYWFTTDLAEDTFYVRLNRFVAKEQRSYAEFAAKLTLAGSDGGHFDKVIVDLRCNGGGYVGEGWNCVINALSRMEFDEFYILVDAGTYSCSMQFASELKFAIPDAMIAGTPTGQAPGFFAAIYDEDYIMPNCGIEFKIPTQYYQTFEANEENALIPDILVWPTIEDYKNSYDTVLECVLAQ